MLLMAAVYWAHRAKTSLLLQMAALGVLLAGPIVAYHLVESLYKAARFENLTLQNLYYQDKMVVRGAVVNESAIRLSNCHIRLKAYKPASGPIEHILHLARPVATGEKRLHFSLQPGGKYPFDATIEGPRYDENLSIALNLRCR
jgi:hypothetical protein